MSRMKFNQYNNQSTVHSSCSSMDSSQDSPAKCIAGQNGPKNQNEDSHPASKTEQRSPTNDDAGDQSGDSTKGRNTACEPQQFYETIFVDPHTGRSVQFAIDQDIQYVNYESEKQMPAIQQLIEKDLSEPYSIYTYRYFIHNWPKLCFLAMHGEECVGAIVCKLDLHKNVVYRGYIAMLAVHKDYRKRAIGTNLVVRAIDAMASQRAAEVVLETEVTNKPALRLYENLGFVRDKRLYRYYLSGVDALRLKLWLSV